MTGVFRVLFSLAVTVSVTVGYVLAAESEPRGEQAARSQISATTIPGTVAVHRSKMLRQWLRDGLLGEAEEIVFCLRVHGRDHWYANFGYYSAEMPVPKEKYFKKEDGLLWAYGEGGALCKLNLRSGKVTVLLHDERGGFRDPHVHYDGGKILFSYRPGNTHNYHLYEINVDGSNLRRLTDGPDDDFEAVYLPDDSIVFVSSRSHRFVNCFYTRVTTLYRMNADGSNIHPLSSNVEHDNTPWVLPDGRIIYMRWEYVDRSQLDYHHLWTMAPDGTGQSIYYGNQHPGTAMLDAKPIPGTRQVIASFNPGHGRPEHMGQLAIVDPSLGPDAPEGAVRFAKGSYRDPYPISRDAFLAVGVPGIAVINRQGMVEYIYQFRGDRSQMACHEPRLIRPRRREPLIAPRSDRSRPNGRLYLSNVYHGRSMEGVQRGEIKRLLVMEQLPKPVNFSGGMQPLTIRGTFTMARLLGTVPVDDNGSAYFEAPALRSLFFVALDKDNMSVKRMQSFTTLQPGETVGCVGCHEPREQTPSHGVHSAALRAGTVQQIQPLEGIPDVLDFARDIQPILNRHCVRCHDAQRREGGIELQGDYTPQYTVSYWTIFRNELVADGRNLPKSNYPPRALGTSASPLMQYLDRSHHDVDMTELERDTIRWWVESSAVYPGTYAALGTGTVAHLVYHPQMKERCGTCHLSSVFNNRLQKDVPAWRFGKTTDQAGRSTNPGSVVNLTTPEHSLVLRAPLARVAGGLELCDEVVFEGTSDAMYVRLLKQFEYARQVLQEIKRFDMPGFRPRAEYIREMKRFGILPPDFGPDDPIDIYDTDRRYWRSFWYQPTAN